MPTDYGTLHWSSDGKPYIYDQSGKQYFLPPIVAAQYDDPKAQAWAAKNGAHIGAPGGTDTVTGQPDATLLKTRGTWNPDTGQYDQGINWDNLASLATGGFVGAGVGNVIAGAGGAGSAAAPATSAAPAAEYGPSLVAGPGEAGTAGYLEGSAAGAGAGAGVGAAGTALAASPSLWSKIAKVAVPALGAGAQVAQGLISANAAKSAAEQQQQATMKALDLQREIWQQQQQNLAPYMGLGPGAISNLQGLTGTRPASQVFGGK